MTSLSIAPGGGPGKSSTGWMHCGCSVDVLGGCIVDVLWMHCGCKAWPPQYSFYRVRLMFKDASRETILCLWRLFKVDFPCH